MSQTDLDAGVRVRLTRHVGAHAQGEEATVTDHAGPFRLHGYDLAVVFDDDPNWPFCVRRDEVEPVS